VMACVGELRNEKGTDKAGSARQKYSHLLPLVWAAFWQTVYQTNLLRGRTEASSLKRLNDPL
jgi:hypothetical protein